ncbi:MAG: PIN domain protein [Candidatus Methanofastidiosum methylothiophilum]|uniref:PIN domain protein n=1 Tax=Candidatus Methanofastidiosum methylothiophilum TaxID=1705564 RepID=A0A150J6L3_9EURY|nr:MAG: PIN domain protein [Candidatus Methanofastidiosum methylthiophilus]
MLNNISDILKDSRIFIDSNIFTYFLLKREEYYNNVKEFFKRIDEKEIIGFINPIVISETYFNYLRVKISEKYNAPIRDVPKLIKDKPEILSEIPIEVVDGILALENIKILEYRSEADIKYFISKYSLLPNDAINAATCKLYNIDNMATNDNDFNRVDFLNLFRP